MELEQEFVCWRDGQDESVGKELKAKNLQSAAKKAVDIWRVENPKLGYGKITVFLRDSNDEIHRVMVTTDSDSDYESPQAFY